MLIEKSITGDARQYFELTRCFDDDGHLLYERTNFLGHGEAYQMAQAGIEIACGEPIAKPRVRRPAGRREIVAT